MEKQIKEPIKKIVTTQMIVYYSSCPRCKKEIVGRSISHYRYNMDQHLKKHGREGESK